MRRARCRHHLHHHHRHHVARKLHLNTSFLEFVCNEGRKNKLTHQMECIFHQQIIGHSLQDISHLSTATARGGHFAGERQSLIARYSYLFEQEHRTDEQGEEENIACRCTQGLIECTPFGFL